MKEKNEIRLASIIGLIGLILLFVSFKMIQCNYKFDYFVLINVFAVFSIYIGGIGTGIDIKMKEYAKRKINKR